MNRDKKNNCIILPFCSLLDGFCVNVLAGTVGLLWMKRRGSERVLGSLPVAISSDSSRRQVATRWRQFLSKLLRCFVFSLK